MRKEEIEKEIYEKAVTKQNRLFKKVLSLTFGIMGIVFAIITTVVAVLPKESTDAIFESNYEKTVFIIIFASFAAVFLLVAIIARLINVKPNYEKYKNQIEKRGFAYYSTFTLYAEMEIMKEKIARLEETVEELKSEK